MSLPPIPLSRPLISCSEQGTEEGMFVDIVHTPRQLVEYIDNEEVKPGDLGDLDIS